MNTSMHNDFRFAKIEKVSEKAKEENTSLLNEREKRFNKMEGARIGDFVRVGNSYTRITKDCGERFQTGGHCGRYYFDETGSCSYSCGNLDRGVKKADLLNTDEMREGEIWFFSKGISGINRGVHFTIKCRVFTVSDDADISGMYLLKTKLECSRTLGNFDNQ